MKKVLLLGTLILFAVTCFAQTQYNTYTGYNPYWHPLGYPDTSTYGETFNAPTNGDNFLTSFGLWLGGPYASGNIIMSAYVAEWNGSFAGTLLYTSDPINYPNTGETELTFTMPGNGLELTPGDSYIIFLSISQYYGQSTGQTYIDGGNGNCPGCAFAYFNNGGNFDELFTTPWDAHGLQPDFAFEANFTSGQVQSTPEPGTMLLLGTGLVGVVGAMRRKLMK